MNIYSIVITVLFCIPVLAKQQHAFLAGSWYPKNKNILQQALQQADTVAQSSYAASVKSQTIRALIAPHAGIRYSGSVTAGTYRLIDPTIQRVIILAPDHSGKTRGVALPTFNQYILPNGSLTVDTQLIQKLSQHELFNFDETVFSKEHSLEMQLPFIIKYCNTAQIIPLIIGTIDCKNAQHIAQQLKTIINKNTIVVISSDFVHYGKRFNFMPFTDHQQLRIRHLNSQAIQLIEKADCTAFESFIRKTGATICGSCPIKILLHLIHSGTFGTVEPQLIGYDTSSKSDTEDSVSYIGMIFTTEKLSEKPIEHQLTQQEQTHLLQQARDILKYMFDTKYDESLYFPLLSFGVTQPLGAFTTLKKKNGNLRGCIGRIVTTQPLYKTIATVMQDTALRDSRFQPVTKQEASTLNLKLSILSQPKKLMITKILLLANTVLF